MFSQNRIKNLLEDFISKAAILGLPNHDQEIVREYTACLEFDLSFNHVTERLYELDIQIDSEYYELAKQLAGLMQIDESEYNYLTEFFSE